MKTVKTSSFVVVLGALAGCTGTDLRELPYDRESAQVEQSVVNGSVRSTNPFAVAIVKKSSSYPGYWGYVRCSGIVLQRFDTLTTVLTARHCVTDNGAVNGTVLSKSELKVTSDPQPGFLIGSGDAYDVSYIDAMAPIMNGSIPDSGSDMAVVGVSGQLPLTGDVRYGINIGPTSNVLNGNLQVFGYGWGVSNDNNSAGTLRVASPMSPVSDNGTKFVYANPGLEGDFVTHGDSGGPVLRWTQLSSGGFYTLYGVESTPVSTGSACPSTAGNWAWLQQQLWGVFISHRGSLSAVLGSATSTPTPGSALRSDLAGLSSRTKWSYSPSAAVLTLSGTLCAFGKSDGAIELGYCAGFDQYRWDLVPSGSAVRLRNRYYGTCMTRATTPRLAACGSSSLEAVFHTQP